MERGLEGFALSLPLTFRFSWHGIRFVGHGAANVGHMVLGHEADVATVPFSAENALARSRLLDFLARLGERDECRLAVTPQSIIRYHGSAAIALPIIRVEVVVAAVALVLRTHPYFELVEALGADTLEPGR